MYKWIQVFNSMKIPTIWWLHESDTYIDMLRDKLPQTVPENIHVLTVSQRTVLALKKIILLMRHICFIMVWKN